MTNRRYIEKMHSIFDVKVHKALGLDKSLSTRVMLNYDRNNDRKEFIILNPQITSEINGKITSWLQENLDIDNIIQHPISYNNIDIDDYQKTVNY